MIFQIMFFYWLLLNSKVNAFNCYVPDGCRIENVYDSLYDQHYNEKGDFLNTAIMCDINNDEYEFKFRELTTQMVNERCGKEHRTFFSYMQVIFKWTSSKNELAILDKKFNLTNSFRYFRFFRFRTYLFLNIWNIKGFDVEILDEYYFNTLKKNSSLSGIKINGCRMDFYHKKKRINSCQDFIGLNITRVESIFQIEWLYYIGLYRQNGIIHLKNVEFKQKMCPLVFRNAFIPSLLVYDVVDSFYKRNIFSFSNETYQDLNSHISQLSLFNTHNINIDLNILHPSVFNDLKSLNIGRGSLNSIDEETFKHLKIQFIDISTIIFKKINHKQGIKWIRQWNNDLNVNLKNIPNDTLNLLKKINLIISKTQTKYPMSKILPDEDFCIYVDFPFNQFVIFGGLDLKYDYKYGLKIEKEFTCTYLWLIQYYQDYLAYFLNIKLNPTIFWKNFSIEFNYSAFNYSLSKCNFEERISRCNKSNYQPNDILDATDFFILNKKIQIAFKISLYPVSLLGLITSLIVVLVILIKDNSDLFKEFKQYNYLYINSIFCMMISVIELLSWMTECFYPFEVFCPEIRKLIAIQFFKIIFKECFVTVFRFMCNFTYVAFALNRISLIGRDHGKIVTFMSEVGIKKYIGVTLFISLSLSWMKYFKYEVNYFYPYISFPISNEIDLVSHTTTTNPFINACFVFNAISDLVNYFLFVVICVVIDICMVVQLRRTLEERTLKSALMNMNQIQNENKKAESEEAVNKAIKMVVINSFIGILFKCPVSIIPLVNVYAQFYYNKHDVFNTYSSFADFYTSFIDSGFYALIQDMSHFFFTFSLSIQMFIYYRFDKKFFTGYKRLLDKVLKKKISTTKS